MTLAPSAGIAREGRVAATRHTNIYNLTANLFVAGFIRSPPMNFLEGALLNGRFSATAGSFVTPIRASHNTAVAGGQPEDCRVTQAGNGKILGEVYTTELMGDHTLVTCRVGGATIIVKAEKTFNRRRGETVGVDFADAVVHLFDKVCGRRIG